MFLIFSNCFFIRGPRAQCTPQPLRPSTVTQIHDSNEGGLVWCFYPTLPKGGEVTTMTQLKSTAAQCKYAHAVNEVHKTEFCVPRYNRLSLSQVSYLLPKLHTLNNVRMGNILLTTHCYCSSHVGSPLWPCQDLHRNWLVAALLTLILAGNCWCAVLCYGIF